MAKARVGGSSAVYITESGKDLFYPAGCTADHVAVLTVSFYEWGGPTTDLNAPSGFTQRDAGTAVIDTYSGNESRVEVWTKSLAGTESSTSLFVSFTSGVYATAVLDVFSGDGDLTFASISTPTISTASGNATAPSASGTSGQLLVAAYGINDVPGASNSGPSGMTIGASAALTTSYARNYWLGLTSTGATGDKLFNLNATLNSAGWSILFDDAGSGGGGGSTELPPLTMPPMRSMGWRR